MIARATVAVFAAISIAGLSLQIVSDFWLPILLGSLFTALLTRLVRR